MLSSQGSNQNQKSAKVVLDRSFAMHDDPDKQESQNSSGGNIIRTSKDDIDKSMNKS